MSITTTIKVGETAKTITLPEGKSLTIMPTPGVNALTGGVAYLLDLERGGTNSKQSWAIGASALPPITGYSGTQKILINCTAGSIDAVVGDAVLGTALISADGASIAAVGGRFTPIGGLAAISGLDCPCDDTASVFRDRSGNLKHLLPAPGYTGAFANAGYATSTAGTDKYVYEPFSKLNFDLLTDSFWMHIGKVNKAAPAGNEAMLGFCDLSAGNYGFYISGRTSGTMAPVFNWNGGSFTNLTTYNTTQLGTMLDGTDHSIDLLYDKVARGIYMFVDGKLMIVLHNVVLVSSPSPTRFGFALGANYQPLAVTGFASVAGKFANVVFEPFKNSGLPLNIRQMISTLAKNPLQPVKNLARMQPPTSAYWLLAWCGQSNEAGASDVPQENSNYGLPTKDAILPTGNTSVNAATNGSIFPAMVEACAQGGKHLINLNTAVGSTSLSQYWCGMFVARAPSTAFSLGAYAIAAGNVYKFTASSGSSTVTGVSGGSAPAWPGSGTVVDGEITWTYVRAATVADVVGTVLAHTNPLYDPNGAFTAIKTNMDAYPGNGFRKAMAISIGQGDKTVGDTLAIYQAALIAATNYALGQGWEVFIGLTCDGTTAGYSTWLSTIGQSARSAALASFVGNASVHAGVDLYATLGPLTVKSYDIGLRPDQLHMNSITANDAGTAWGNLLAATA